MSPIRVSKEFDQRLADWFEADADLAPPTVLATVMAAYPSIPQRRASRVPRRFHTMTRLALMGAAAAVLIAAGIGGLLFAARQTGPRPDTQPSSSPAPSVAEVSAAPAVALPRTFTSNQNGYTIESPADWLPTPATTAWLPGTETRWGDPALDVLQSPAARVVAASQPLADGQTPDQWYQAYCRLGAPKSDCGAYATTWKQVGVGPSKGYLDIDGQPALPGSIKVGAPMY